MLTFSLRDALTERYNEAYQESVKCSFQGVEVLKADLPTLRYMGSDGEWYKLKFQKRSDGIYFLTLTTERDKVIYQDYHLFTWEYTWVPERFILGEMSYVLFTDDFQYLQESTRDVLEYRNSVSVKYLLRKLDIDFYDLTLPTPRIILRKIVYPSVLRREPFEEKVLFVNKKDFPKIQQITSFIEQNGYTLLYSDLIEVKYDIGTYIKAYKLKGEALLIENAIERELYAGVCIYLEKEFDSYKHGYKGFY